MRQIRQQLFKCHQFLLKGKLRLSLFQLENGHTRIEAEVMLKIPLKGDWHYYLESEFFKDQETRKLFKITDDKPALLKEEEKPRGPDLTALEFLVTEIPDLSKVPSELEFDYFNEKGNIQIKPNNSDLSLQYHSYKSGVMQGDLDLHYDGSLPSRITLKVPLLGTITFNETD